MCMTDLRTIKCACGDPKCPIGISFDTDGEDKPVLRFYDKHNSETYMKINRAKALKLIEALKDFV